MRKKLNKIVKRKKNREKNWEKNREKNWEKIKKKKYFIDCNDSLSVVVCLLMTTSFHV